MSDQGLRSKLRRLLGKMHESGVLSVQQVQMILRTLHVDDMRVENICVPRSDISYVELDASESDVIEAFRTSMHSRLAVTDGDLDNVVGVIYARDWIRRPESDDTDFAVDSLMREPFFVPEAISVLDALALLKRQRVSIAFCRDDHGGVSGLITFEDIIETVFDEIEDEYDDDTSFILSRSDSEWVLDASMPVEELCDELGSTLPQVPVDTVGGYVSHTFGMVPETGQSIETELGEFVVLHSDGKRVSRVKFLPLAEPV